ncbi:MAG: hypothetical protein GY813_04240 [Halieaceae bacterium]|nr:hypothetical protein [Halieaceae bacterium]
MLDRFLVGFVSESTKMNRHDDAMNREKDVNPVWLSREIPGLWFPK